MDNLLCDELVQEIFQRLPPSTSSAVPLVCKRWLFLHRISKSSLSVRLPTHPSFVPSFSSLLSRYPRLTSLTVTPDHSTPLFSLTPDAEAEAPSGASLFWDHHLLSVASNCRNLRHLRFLAGPVSPSALVSPSSSCKHLTSLSISSFRPFCFRWLTSFPSLKELSVVDCGGANSNDFSTLKFDSDYDDGVPSSQPSSEMELPLEFLCLSGIGAGDRGMGWLWKSCTKLRRLQLRSCEGTGDGASFSSFVSCLPGLQELELRTCRTIADGVLLRLAEHGGSLNSLLLYDGGSRDGLHHFISRCSCTLQRLDLRLPLDLDNDHLSAVAENFRCLVSLRLQSCCLVTGEGLKTLGTAVSSELEELALINCDVIEREPGLLTTLAQNLSELKKLDLSYNEMLVDKEFVSMLVSCKNLVDIKLRGCRRLTNATLVSMLKICKLLENLDILQCYGIGVEAVELFVLNSPRLRRVRVEESKLSAVAKVSASQKFIEIVS
ncbi:PREDICTED: F-box/LRR-repeat protein 4-like [Nelumbo nucifera]|uniref:F-box/LRR-repeat protein 4-like n=2 Tax=Nelumbo nucifera TaxID=4432 RepID=A0A822YSQ9_NELNU|nr:PREDICTED: F-box/LRR-repeat protein 4-like [Nelumbo nucifera]DAD34469.1 TPA_asm: hypothetical protein HUJ06_005109 [Nelumbo nucifera]DAD34473.1 TPA_asm: hypothetical protein HUJ06_005113 [Nelumbo nucifera]